MVSGWPHENRETVTSNPPCFWLVLLIESTISRYIVKLSGKNPHFDFHAGQFTRDIVFQKSRHAKAIHTVIFITRLYWKDTLASHNIQLDYKRDLRWLPTIFWVFPSELEILVSGMITSAKKWSQQKNHDISIRHYSPYKATSLAEGEWNRRPNRVNLTFERLELTSNPRKRLVLILHFFPDSKTKGYHSSYQISSSLIFPSAWAVPISSTRGNMSATRVI